MKKNFFLLIFPFLFANSQVIVNPVSLNKNLEIKGGLGYDLLKIYYEQPLTYPLLLELSSGIDEFSYSENNFDLNFVSSAGLKLLINRKNRLKKNKPLYNNSGNYFKASAIYVFNTKDFIPSFIWGQKFNTNKHFSFYYETGLGANKGLLILLTVGFGYSLPFWQ